MGQDHRLHRADFSVFEPNSLMLINDDVETPADEQKQKGQGQEEGEAVVLLKLGSTVVDDAAVDEVDVKSPYFCINQVK